MRSDAGDDQPRQMEGSAANTHLQSSPDSWEPAVPAPHDQPLGQVLAPPYLSVVVPVYGCAGCLRELHRRITTTLETMCVTYEIVLVDDRSQDEAWDVIGGLARKDPHVRGVRLSRNFGQHLAITAGLAQAQGHWAVVMDCDLQDPPEEIPRLLEQGLLGFDVVHGRRRSKQASRGRRTLGAIWFWLMNSVLGARIDPGHGTFSLVSRKVIDALLAFGDRERHYLLMLHWIGFNATSVDYDLQPRAIGKTTYTIRSLMRHAIGGIVFQTTTFLRWVTYLGFLLAGCGGGLATYLVIARLTGSAYPGWTSLAVISLLLSGFVIISTGVTGLYVGKVFEQVKDRPLYIVDETTRQRDDASRNDMHPTDSHQHRSAPITPTRG